MLVGSGITLCLSLVPHPRDKRACLPSFITPQSLRTFEGGNRTRQGQLLQAPASRARQYPHCNKVKEMAEFLAIIEQKFL
jgi:hypothetical protein